jgi:hypothetical protein
VADDYFDETMVNRQRLLWAVATRRQLERWEPLVASVVRPDPLVPECVTVWSAEMEHHFALIAARNLIRAMELPPPMAVQVDDTLRAELIEGRDLHEHWVENMPIFNLTPRRSRSTGRARTSPNGIPSTGHTGGSIGATRPALA